MKIAQHSGGGDFYESFSDLIFGTLIIFLVVVLALIVQVHETVERMDRQIGGVVSPNRFTGSIIFERDLMAAEALEARLAFNIDTIMRLVLV